MERKNTILLTVIAVATLLVAVVGATFAYFTASTGATGSAAGNQNATSAKMASVKITKSTTKGGAETIYPGSMIYVGSSINAVLEDTEGATNSNKTYTVTYDLNGNVTLSQAFESDVVWRLYRTTTQVTTPVTCEAVVPGHEADNDTIVTYSQECKEDDALEDTNDYPERPKTLVASDTVNGTTATISLTDETVDTGTTNYYYLVVDYKNVDSDQNNDKGKTITATLTDITAKKTEEKKG